MSKKKRNPFLKKRYIPLYLLLTVMLFVHGCLSFRISDEEWKKNLVEKGQVEPTIHNYEVEDRNMHYVHIGNDTLPLFIFIHGTPGSSDAFKEYLADTMLSNHIQMISVDRPGFGYSDYGKTAESLAKQSIYLKPILERHKQAPKIYLVGHSLGGPIVARMAMDYEELMDGLIMLAPSIAPELEPYEWYREPMDWVGLRWALPPAIRVSNQEILLVKGNLTEMLPLWKNITIPVIVMQGEEDMLVPKENADFAKKMLINSERVDVYMLPEENHFIVWSKYDEIVKLILSEIGN